MAETETAPESAPSAEEPKKKPLSLGELVTAELEIEATRSAALDNAEATVAEHEAKSKLAVVPSGPRIVKP